MSADLNHVTDVVEAILTAEMPSGTFQVNGRTIWWRNLDDPEADTQPRPGGAPLGYPLIEFEYVDGKNVRDEYGSPGYNRWEERSGVMFHVHVERGQDDMSLARAVMTAVIDLFCGRYENFVQFRDAMPAYKDTQGTGLTRGVSRAIECQYDYRGR